MCLFGIYNLFTKFKPKELSNTDKKDKNFHGSVYKINILWQDGECQI